MVTTDTTQLNRECDAWREHLRSYRNELGHLRDQLQMVAQDQNDKELLTEVEHFHNQFYIQQINIHDLKQSIKTHDRRLVLESSLGGASDQTLIQHEHLYEQLQTLQHTIEELRQDFNQFLVRS